MDVSIIQVSNDNSNEIQLRCIQAFFAAKWPNGFRCASCGHSKAHQICTRRLPLFQCKNCGTQTSLTAQTILHGSRTPLSTWFRAFRMLSSPEGINALQLSRTIGVTYKTAWLMCQKIRHAMSCAESKCLLDDVVRIMDGVYCRRAKGYSGWDRQEQSVLIGSCENELGELDRIKIEKQDKQNLKHSFAAPNPDAFIHRNVALRAIKKMVIHRFLGPTRNETLNKIVRDAEWRLARLFRGIGPKYLQYYLHQYCYGWNRRRQGSFDHLLHDCATTKTITLPALTGKQVIPTRLPFRAGFSKTKRVG